MKTVRIGTRGSKLALAQAEICAAAFSAKGIGTELRIVRTRGDIDQSAALSQIGKGAFTDEFTQLLQKGEIDVAVHSAKDLPTDAEKDNFFCLPREDARDLLILRENKAERIGTGSPRRAASAAEKYPGAQILPVRGNVDTRLRKLASGDYDALVLAAAGLIRLGLYDGKSDRFTWDGRTFFVRYFEVNECVPAACQGIIAVEGKAGRLISDAETKQTALLERKLQRALGGDCEGGVGAYFDGTRLYAQRDGKRVSLVYGGEDCICRLAELLV